VLAGSPLACIRCASAAFDLSSAFGRPIDWPRDRRASRAAAHRSRPNSSSSSAMLASTPATMRAVAFDVSIPSRTERERCHATLTHRQGVPIALVAAWLGHADVSFTLRTCVRAQPEALEPLGFRNLGPRASFGWIGIR
jgi:hypothetical protein